MPSLTEPTSDGRKKFAGNREIRYCQPFAACVHGKPAHNVAGGQNGQADMLVGVPQVGGFTEDEDGDLLLRPQV